MRKSPSNVIDIKGNKYGYWTVLEQVANKYKQIYYKCRCACGFEAVVGKKALLHGKSLSCGCVKSASRNRQKIPNYGKKLSEEDKQKIRLWYPINGSRFLAISLGRSQEAIRAQAHILGIKVQRKISRRGDEWREEEIKALETHYPKGGAIGCLAVLPKRSKDAIWTKANKLGIKLESHVGRNSTSASRNSKTSRATSIAA